METPDTSSVILDLRTSEAIKVGGGIVIKLLHKSGNVSRLRITAPRTVTIKIQPGDTNDVAPSMADCLPS